MTTFKLALIKFLIGADDGVLYVLAHVEDSLRQLAANANAEAIKLQQQATQLAAKAATAQTLADKLSG